MHRIHRRSSAVVAQAVLAVLLASTAAAWAQQAYRVGQHDVVKVTVWGQPELSGNFTVDAAGGISLPLIGAVKATGRTVAELEADIRSRYADGYVRNPQVTIDVAEYKSQRVFVVGEVRSPGAVPLSGSLSLIEALARVGSLSEFAGGDIVVIRRAAGAVVNGPVLPNDPGARELLRVDVKLLQSRGPTSNVALQDGDTIVVPRAEVVYINGQINAPGTYTYEREMTVLQLISRANGVTDAGTTRRLKVQRVVAGKRVEIKVELGDKIQPGDTVVVASRWF
jgi:polysaccharide biosynthesis/export protein